MKMSTRLFVCIASLAFHGNLKAETIVERGTTKWCRLAPAGKLIYSKDAKGNETPGRVTEVGIENLRLVSEFDAPIPGHHYGDPKKTDRAENHAWHGIQLGRNTENTWVRNITGKYFGWSLVSASGKHATVQDCVSLGHASRITGGRR